MIRIERYLSQHSVSLLPEVWMEGIVHCDCGTCLFLTELTRELSRERFDALTILHFVIKKGGSRVARHGKSEAQREYYQARVYRKWRFPYKRRRV